ncbi:MAG: hypothetical protein ABSE79_09505 [Terriglobia bacterium]|jgi:hypothetical protein
MGKMGYGYGSEFHLLRYLGYHRRRLNLAIEKQTGGRMLDWLDFSFDARGRFPHLDAELKGLEFLPPDFEHVKSAWTQFWPQTGNVPNWDAVGHLQLESHTEFVLVEAKAHASELGSDCGAREEGGRKMIREAFATAIEANAFRSSPEKWLRKYYQCANRLATLHFLMQHNVPSRLVFIYFTGEKWPAGTEQNREPLVCPKDEREWGTSLQEMYDHLGLTKSSVLEERVHRVFLPVCGQSGERAEHLAA